MVLYKNYSHHIKKNTYLYNQQKRITSNFQGSYGQLFYC